MAQIDLEKELTAFNREFDTEFESRAGRERAEFIRVFPLSRLKGLVIDDYVIGKQQPSFCAYVEPLTGSWAYILGATSFKFGIYYGKIRSDERKRYRFVEKKFGDTTDQAFRNVKKALLELIDAGKALNFEDIDDNPLSQMFKAKILSLYFPERFLNVCSADHIAELASKLGIDEDLFVSEQQHDLLQAKLRHPIAKDWSNPKFMTFLYNTYIRSASDRRNLKKPRKRMLPKLNVDEMLENQRKIGEMSEDYALEWEKDRLRGLDFGNLIRLIDDRRDRPAYGYDFLSHTEPHEERYIEIKSVGRNWAGTGFRFFLSQKEHEVSQDPKFRDRYYFYLVYYSDGRPSDLEEWKAADLYEISERGPNGYILKFDREKSN